MSLPVIGRRALAGVVLAGLTAAALSAADIALDDRRSGYAFMGGETRAMQDDDSANPGMLFVLDGEALWRRKEGDAAKSCADCHGDAIASMSGAAALREPGTSRAHRLCRPSIARATHRHLR